MDAENTLYLFCRWIQKRKKSIYAFMSLPISKINVEYACMRSYLSWPSMRVTSNIFYVLLGMLQERFSFFAMTTWCFFLFRSMNEIIQAFVYHRLLVENLQSLKLSRSVTLEKKQSIYQSNGSELIFFWIPIFTDHLLKSTLSPVPCQKSTLSPIPCR